VSEPKPRLELVAGGGERHAAEPVQMRPARASWLPVLAVLMGIALALALWQILAQGARIEVLGAELAQTRSAYRDHLERVRGSLGSLETELAALRELVDRDPLPPPAAPASAAP